MYKVEQIDRQAAWNYLNDALPRDAGEARYWNDEMLAGKIDGSPCVQAFAKHRILALGEVK